MTAFVAQTCPPMRKGTAKLTVTALRSLLGWLHLGGRIRRAAGGGGSRGRAWRLAVLPPPLDPAQV